MDLKINLIVPSQSLHGLQVLGFSFWKLIPLIFPLKIIQLKGTKQNCSEIKIALRKQLNIFLPGRILHLRIIRFVISLNH